ncbi:MAG TPA: hypothetical protein VGK59_11390 [Ohtaekwangia sp.]
MSKTLTSKQYLSQLTLIYFAQAGMMLIFAAIVFALNYIGKMGAGADESTSSLLTNALVGVVIIGFSASHFLYNFMVSKIDSSLSLQKKMPKYTGAVILRSACLELPGMFASVVFFMTGNVFILLIPVFAGIIFFLLRPTVSSIAEDLKLSPNDRALLNDPDAVVAEIEPRQKK